MALRLIEGFDVYGTSTAGRGNMARNPAFPVVSSLCSPRTVTTGGIPARTGIGFMFFGGDRAEALRINPGWSGNTVGVGAALHFTVLPASTGVTPRPFVFLTGAGAVVCALTLNLDGSLSVNTGVSTAAIGTSVAASVAGVISPASWKHVEVKLTVGTVSTGAVEVRVNGVTVINASGLNFGTVAPVFVANFYGSSNVTSTADHRMEDLVCWDTTGSGVIDFYGDGYVQSMLPTANSAVTWGVTGAASNVAAINPVAPDGATTTINATTAGLVDTYVLPDVSGSAVSIGGVQTTIDVSKTDAGAATMTHGILSGASVAASANTTPSTTTYGYLNAMHPVDPATGSAWGVAAVNAALLRVNRVT